MKDAEMPKAKLSKHKSTIITKGLGLEIKIDLANKLDFSKAKQRIDTDIEMYKHPFYKNTSSSLRNKVISDEEMSSPSPIFPLLSP